VKIDLLYEQIPLPHGPTTEREYFWQALEQVQGSRIPHPAVMKSIELFGRYVIPEFDRS